MYSPKVCVLQAIIACKPGVLVHCEQGGGVELIFTDGPINMVSVAGLLLPNLFNKSLVLRKLGLLHEGSVWSEIIRDNNFHLNWIFVKKDFL